MLYELKFLPYANKCPYTHMKHKYLWNAMFLLIYLVLIYVTRVTYISTYKCQALLFNVIIIRVVLRYFVKLFLKFSFACTMSISGRITAAVQTKFNPRVDFLRYAVLDLY